MHKKSIFNLIFQLLIIQSLVGQTNPNSQPIELGKVQWNRNYDNALEKAKKENKPVLILFQEVPGCATCQNYGNNVLSHPLIIDAIENEFIPLAIYNNKGGHDKKILSKYNEPSWNNPVVRIVDKNGKDIITRLNGNYSDEGLVSHMLLALSSGFYGQPEYLKLLNAELSLSDYDKSEAVFSMYCFWSGEAHLGELDGITKTEPGFMNGKEVVKVNFDPSVIDEKEIANHAAKANCSLEKKKSKFRADKDPQYYLKNSIYRSLALSDLQKTKINTAIKQGKDASIYLSPSQKKALTFLKNKNTKSKKLIYTLDLNKGWSEMMSTI
ncbi:MAG: hypothetical protein HKO66_04925 [Saprospiraceae bacterium]|nr:hypothetical protein [Saprospiraceae bacterium]NNL91555.1 hypothetical protein [Saprospiraceae bacterium]